MESVLTELFHTSRADLALSISHLIDCPHQRADIVQDAFISCWRLRHNLAHVKDLKSYACRAVINTAYNTLRVKKNRPAKPLLEDVQSKYVLTDEVCKREHSALLAGAIMRLPPLQRSTFLLKTRTALTYEEIALAEGVPEGTVKSRVHMAVVRLRKMLQPEVVCD